MKFVDLSITDRQSVDLCLGGRFDVNSFVNIDRPTVFKIGVKAQGNFGNLSARITLLA